MVSDDKEVFDAYGFKGANCRARALESGGGDIILLTALAGWFRVC